MTRPDTSSAFAEISAITSELVWETRRSGPSPRATIAIPTYKRFDTLLEAIASATAQTGTEPPDIVIVDNEGHGAKPSAVQKRMGEVGECRVRYYINPQNLGMFGNWNRCIELAETPWLTILNDDDLLRPGFLERSFAALARLSAPDGIVCRKGLRDRRAEPASKPDRKPHLRASGRRRDSAAERSARPIIRRWSAPSRISTRFSDAPR